MRLSTRSTYGMRALAEIALGSGRGPVSAALIARRQGLSVAYLEQLLHRLKRQGLVKSVRGPRGGYLLARDPARITMADVVRVLDGRAGLGDGRVRDAPRRAQPIAQALWASVHERLAQTLAQVTLRDVCAQAAAAAGAPLEHRYVFHI